MLSEQGEPGCLSAQETVAAADSLLVGHRREPVEIALSTGRRATLRVREVVVFPQRPGIPLRRHLDIEDFYSFIDHFMERVEQKHC